MPYLAARPHEQLIASDDDLRKFEADGAPLPVTNDQGYVEHDGARIWYATYGSGSPVILLHGGLGHGRSTRDARPYTYELMASDVVAVMDALHIEKAGLVGWSDGACIALVLAANAPTRVAGVFFFACNMDPSGVRPIEPSPILDRCFGRHAKDYAQLSAIANERLFVFRYLSRFIANDIAC